MQIVFIGLYDSGGSLISLAGYQDNWVGNGGGKFGMVGVNFFSSGQGSLPGAGSASIDISRVSSNVDVLWDSGGLISGTSTAPISRVDVEFWYYAYNGGGVSFFGNESVDLVKVEGTSVPEPTLLLIDLNGGEELLAGQTETIAWDSTGTINFVAIDYSDANGISWTEIDPNTPNDGEYDWIVPEVTSNQCLVKVSDVADPNVYDTSDDVFTIYVCQPLSADLNDDCKVTLDDFGILADDWLNTYIFGDLVNMASEWLNCGYSIQSACWE